jgi:hypothetical protein
MRKTLYSESEAVVFEPALRWAWGWASAAAVLAALVVTVLAWPGDLIAAACADEPAFLCGGVRIAARHSSEAVAYYLGSVAAFAVSCVLCAMLTARAYALVPESDRETLRPSGDVLCLCIFAGVFIFLGSHFFLIMDFEWTLESGRGRSLFLTPVRIAFAIMCGLATGAWLFNAVLIVRKCRHPDNDAWSPPRRPR